MKLYRYILPAVAVISLSACSITRNSMYAPDSTRLEITMDDLEYLGETEISVSYRTYLGFISVIDYLNGEPYDGVERKSDRFGMQKKVDLKLYGRLQRASYKLVDDFPDAEYYVVTRQTKSKTNLFLGGDVTVTAKVKAYRLK